MNTTISNDRYTVTVSDKGAELQSFYDIKADIEYIWTGNPDIWKERSPLLFPIVGKQKDDYYEYEGEQYSMPMHGFAKECSFTRVLDNNILSYSLSSSDEIRSYYPFDFELIITYTLADNSLLICFDIKNPDYKPLPFSIGAHPGFNVPLVKGESYTDYYLLFEAEETSDRYPLKERLLSNPVPYLKSQTTLPLSPDIFNDGALIFKDLKSKRIDLRSRNNSHGVRVDFKDFSYLGLWAFPNAPYICIEPWNGIASSLDSDHSILNKEGMHLLAPGESASYTYSISVF